MAVTGDSISAAVLTHIRKACGRKAKPVVAREFSLGRTPVRADLAILGDEFIGVEVKGPRDSLRRLSNQMSGYVRHFDRTILVVDNRHLKHIDREVLSGVSLWSFDIEGKLREMRAAEDPEPVTAEAYLEMMTQQERRRLLPAQQTSANVGQIDRETARAAFFEAFRRRYTEKSREFWTATSRRRVSTTDLPLLSRFLDQRNEIKRIAADKDEFWQKWSDQNTCQES